MENLDKKSYGKIEFVPTGRGNGMTVEFGGGREDIMQLILHGLDLLLSDPMVSQSAKEMAAHFMEMDDADREKVLKYGDSLLFPDDEDADDNELDENDTIKADTPEHDLFIGDGMYINAKAEDNGISISSPSNMTKEQRLTFALAILSQTMEFVGRKKMALTLAGFIHMIDSGEKLLYRTDRGNIQ